MLGSVITKEVEDYALMYGVPAVLKGHVCKCAEKLVFDDNKAKCKKCGLKYIKDSNNKVSEE